MTPISREVQELTALSDEELISRIGPGPGGDQSEMVHRILDLRNARNQDAAAKAVLQATEKQAAAGDALVKATADLVGATRRLAAVTLALVVMTFLLVLAAAVQAYVMTRPTSHSAWVLWWNSVGTWEPIRTWPTRQKCEEDKPHGTTALQWRCLPDTVDPRGAKGK